MGVYVAIHWEPDNDVEVCKGHVDRAEFLAECKPQGVEIPDDWEISHIYARWIPLKHSEYDTRIEFEKEKKRGNFPITIMEAPLADKEAGR